uniref:Ymf100 n=1 Tax=Phytopythium vexans TaxID=907947 RepID=UPI00202857B8|nr:Ymf100 [Phytopythium vexans]YP_010395072.1 Ymf100 [Phytopythium vexans]DAZ89457.1 TPA_asm: Ymf100 [Phytopythium vexans]DAZ89509.1 TPA_asm: Ymf100 [Phytopythium vexans]
MIEKKKNKNNLFFSKKKIKYNNTQKNKNNKFKNNFFFKKNTYKKKKKLQKLKTTNYLYIYPKIKKGIFLKKPSYNDILYPFNLNLKLINEYLKKK